jgi:outer membrane protein OmpA-like peptidoglycan-associated protein
MRYILLYLILLSPILNAKNQFEYIQPISVEFSSEKKVVINENKIDKNTTKESLVHKKTTQQKQENPEQDSDGDGIIDSKDNCPNTTDKFIIDNHGCPIAPTLNIKFESKKYDITDTLLQEVKTFSEFLKKHNNYQVIIYGYTDNVGKAKENKILSQKRADSVKKAFIMQGVNSTKLTAIGRGEDDPIADNTTPEGREKNRRIIIELIE